MKEVIQKIEKEKLIIIIRGIEKEKLVPLETQYAMKLESTQPIVVQYGRLDNRQVNLAYYTTLAY